MNRYLVGSIIGPFGETGLAEIVVQGQSISEIIPHDGDARGRASGGATTGSQMWAAYAVPGFIDLHTHGGAGHDIMDASTESLAAIARHHVSHGTTTFLGSTLTAPLHVLQGVVDKARKFRATASSAPGPLASLQGIHLEGPWISPKNAGAQKMAHIHAPDGAALSFVRTNRDMLRMVTFSYHYGTAPRLLQELKDLGIIAACGHDETIDEQARAAFKAGLNYLTHAYCVSGSFRRVKGRKHLGSLEMALMTPGVIIEVVADGHHITRHFWDFIRHNKSIDDIVIVSDSVRWAGLAPDPDRVISMGGVDVVVDDGVAWLPDRSAYAGSVSSVHHMFRRLVRDWGVPIQDAVAITSWNQAKALRLDKRLGSIEPGKQADFVLLDEDLEIVGVVKSGVAAEPTSPGRLQ